MSPPSRRSWLFTAALFLPATLLYLAHYSRTFDGTGVQATGFIQYDMPYYLANAREYLERGGWGLRYPQPYSYDLQNEPLYFQPQIFLLAVLWKWTKLDPGLLFNIFGVCAGILCVRVWQRVLQQFAPSEGSSRVFGDVLFVWGGGALVLFGLMTPLASMAVPDPASVRPFQYDPANGWWFLNLGRNLVYPFEAYYHLVFFSAILALSWRRYAMVAGLLLLLATSHPFTGVAGLLIFLSWSVVERFYLGNRDVPLFFIAGLAAVLAGAGWYYGVWLPQDAEHRALMEQWTLPWLVQAATFVPAYLLVGILAAVRVRTPLRLRRFLSSSMNRFLLVWLVVNFALENHEFAFTPHQPIHFARGYVWACLFLMGAPWLMQEAIPWLRRQGRAALLGGCIAIFTLFAFDNTVWLAVMTGVQRRPVAGLALSGDERSLLAQMNVLSPTPDRLISQNTRVGYMATVYTSLRPFVGHPYNTPYADERRAALEAFFQGHVTDSLLSLPAWVIVEKSQGSRLPNTCETAYENDSYLVCRQSSEVRQKRTSGER